MIIRCCSIACSATNSRSSPATRARRKFIWRWSAAKCRAPSPTGRRSKALNSNWLADNKIRLLAQWGLKKLPAIGNVPSIFDFIKTDADRAAIKLVVARLEYGRPFFVPPGVPPDRVEALRRAFDATVKDPAFLGEATMARIDIDPLSGEEVQTLVEEVSKTPPTSSRAFATRLRTNNMIPKSGYRFSEKIMLHYNARAQSLEH